MGYYVRWAFAKRIHMISISKSGSRISFDRTMSKFTATNGSLTTKCGEAVPDEHQAIEQLTIPEHNNELCVTCWRTNTPW